MNEPVRGCPTEYETPKKGELVITVKLIGDGGAHVITQIISEKFLEDCGEDAVHGRAGGI